MVCVCGWGDVAAPALTASRVERQDGNKHLSLNIERVKYWMANGAQPSDRVAWLLGRAGVLPMPPQRRSFKPPTAAEE